MVLFLCVRVFVCLWVMLVGLVGIDMKDYVCVCEFCILLFLLHANSYLVSSFSG